ncbi:MAG: phosphoglycerate kinase [Proteobacteria bacterium]|nr:phosphoglycerate kinase [Pseudomonadota bacterium]
MLVNKTEAETRTDLNLHLEEKTAKLYADIVKEAKTIIWNGPMGVFEMANFEKGSKAIADAIVDTTSRGAYSLVGGGDTVMAINQFGLADRISYVSTGGGALLEYVEGKSLPGEEAIY